MSHLKLGLLVLSVALSVIMYYPLYRRMYERKTTGDYSKPAWWMILSIQFVNGTLAASERAWFLVTIYCVHIVLVSAAIWMIYKFYD